VKKTLIVTAHPDPDSLTAEVARRLAGALAPGSVEIADLAAEGFDPRFTVADRRTYRGDGDASADVLREQQRLEGVTDLVLVFPVWWWSMPALLKGWIDRVFINGWAFEVGADGTQRNLGGLTTHLLPLAGDSAGTYDRHGYEQAFLTQLQHGIIDYCGSHRGAVAFVYDSEREDSAAREADVTRAIEIVATAVRG
jgi:NAD(P)H dehydrogenase (quinone)